MRVLVAEDEAIVSMLIEDELSRAAFTVVGPFSTCAAASEWLERDTPDLAVLDHQLRDGPCLDVASVLLRRSVPFLLLTGSGPADLPDALRHVPRIAKPSSLDMLPALLLSLHAGRVVAPEPRFRLPDPTGE